ncbi:MAG: NUDIX hydrolase [Pseudomonadota bacterium]
MDLPDAEDVPIKDAATLILVRDPETAPKILLGRRQRNAVFLPNRFVFPGGAVEPEDANVDLAGELQALCLSRLQDGHQPATAYPAAAIRELWEETGLAYGAPGTFDAPADWISFAAKGLRPKGTGLVYFMRAVTPPGRPRRFDARFFLANATHLFGDIDDFSGRSGELSELAWVPVGALQKLLFAPITTYVLDQLIPQLPDLGAPKELIRLD